MLVHELRAVQTAPRVIATIYESKQGETTEEARGNKEEKAADAIEEDYGKEHDGRGKGRGQHSQRYFVAALFRRHLRQFPIFEVPENVSPERSRNCRSIAENTSASPPNTMVFTVPPPALMARNAAAPKADMDKNTAAVARMLPENNRNHHAGKHEADGAFTD